MTPFVVALQLEVCLPFEVVLQLEVSHAPLVL